MSKIKEQIEELANGLLMTYQGLCHIYEDDRFELFSDLPNIGKLMCTFQDKLAQLVDSSGIYPTIGSEGDIAMIDERIQELYHA